MSGSGQSNNISSQNYYGDYYNQYNNTSNINPYNQYNYGTGYDSGSWNSYSSAQMSTNNTDNYGTYNSAEISKSYYEHIVQQSSAHYTPETNKGKDDKHYNEDRSSKRNKREEKDEKSWNLNVDNSRENNRENRNKKDDKTPARKVDSKEERINAKSLTIEPCSIIMLRGLKTTTTSETITQLFKQYGRIDSVRLVRNKDGESKGFGFVEFHSVDQANFLMEKTSGVIDIDGRTIYLEYSRDKNSSLSQKDLPSNSRPSKKDPETVVEARDWFCGKCGGSNFARRLSCYVCQSPRPANPLYIEIEKTEPSPVLVVRGLGLFTNEESLQKVFSPFAPIKEIRLMREKISRQSRGFAFVEFFNTEVIYFLFIYNFITIHRMLLQLYVKYKEVYV